MNTYKTIISRRSIRKFKQDSVCTDALKKMVNAGRLAPQGANLQPIKYIIVNEKSLTDDIFKTTAWAAYIKPQGNPLENEKPTAYIVVIVDTEIKKTGYDTDAGAAVENILLTASEDGIGTCWLGAIDRNKIKEILNIPDKYIIHTMIAVGYPLEQPIEEEEKGSIKYYKDEFGVLHVPKRKIDDVILCIYE